MAKLDKVNGVVRINCIITSEGIIPHFYTMRGPLLTPRPIEVDDIKVMLFKGVELRAVERNVVDYKMEDTILLTPEVVDKLVDEFNRVAPVKQPKKETQKAPVQQPKKETQKAPVQQPKKEEVVKPAAEPVVEKKEEEVVKPAAEPVVEKKEEAKAAVKENTNTQKSANKK